MNVDDMLAEYEKIMKPVFLRFDLLETQTYLKKFSPGYGHIHAITRVYNLICAGGLTSYHGSSAWPLIWPAMSGAYDLGLDKLGDCLKSMIFYYHRSGRSKLKRMIPEDFFAGFSIDESLKPGDLTSAYYDLYRGIGKDEFGWVPRDLFPQIMSSHAEKFAPPPFRVPPVPEAGFCSISKNVTLKNEPISLCIRFQTDEPKMSGWQFYGQTETVKMINDPDIWSTCPLGVAAIFEPRILDFYKEKAAPKVSYERELDGTFTRII